MRNMLTVAVAAITIGVVSAVVTVRVEAGISAHEAQTQADQQRAMAQGLVDMGQAVYRATHTKQANDL